MTSREQAAEFLKTFKEQREKLGWIYVVDRHKNQDALSRLGFTKKQREEIILSLTAEDYCEGPELDRNASGNVWVFGKIEEGQEIYIKLKVTHVPICLSFHPAEHPLQYSLKGREEGRQR